MALENGKIRGKSSKKALKTGQKGGNFHSVSFQYIYYTAKERKSKAEDTTNFKPRQKFDFYR